MSQRKWMFSWLVLVFLLSVFSSGAVAQSPSLTTSAKPAPSALDPSKYTKHTNFAPFLNGDGFKSTLLIENLFPAASITARPSLILSSGDVQLDPITLPPSSTATVDITAFMLAHGYTDERGTTVVNFDFNHYGSLATAVQIENEASHLFLNYYGASPEAYWTGDTYDGVIWAPNEGTQGEISLTNTTYTPQTAYATFFLNGHTEKRTIQLPPWHTYTLPITELVAQSRQNGVGIHFGFDPASYYYGSVLVEGQLFNKKTGFAKTVHFTNKFLKYASTSLRSHFVLLGQQPASDGFPMGVSFRSVAAVRNADDTPVQVIPTVRFLSNDGTTQAIALDKIVLEAGQSQLIDLSQAQEEGRLPASVRHASLDLLTKNNDQNIVAELFSFNSSTGGYVVGSSMASYPTRGTGSIWRIDGTYQTQIVVENVRGEDDKVTLRLASDQGTYFKTFDVAGYEILQVNVKDLQQNKVPGQKGNLLAGNNGVMAIFGTLGSKFSFDKIIHSAEESDYVGLPPNACDVTTSMQVITNPDPSIDPTFLVFDIWGTVVGEWYSGLSNWYITNPNVTFAVDPITGNPHLAPSSSAVDMQEYTGQIGSNGVVESSCVACSYDTFYAIGSLSFDIQFHLARLTSVPRYDATETYRAGDWRCFIYFTSGNCWIEEPLVPFCPVAMPGPPDYNTSWGASSYHSLATHAWQGVTWESRLKIAGTWTSWLAAPVGLGNKILFGSAGPCTYQGVDYYSQ